MKMRTDTTLGCRLMSEAVHDEPMDKLACRIAVALEEKFIAAAWPSGQLFGSEQMLCRQFGVSRRIMREAVRVLELRGTARLRRGVHPGLEIAAPDDDLVVDVLRGYAFLNGVNEAERTEAIDFLDRIKRRLEADAQPGAGTPGLDFLQDFTSNHLAPGTPPVGVLNKKFHRVRAGRIASNLIEQFIAREFEPGRRIGSEAEISAHFQADRSITRQAIRLLESSGMVTSRPGRGNGLIIQQPPSGPVCRLLCCYFAANGLPVSKAFALFRAMSVEAVRLVASKASPADIQRLRQTLAADWPPNGSAQLSNVFSTEDSQFQAINNRIISLFLRSIRGYAALTVAEGGLAMPTETAFYFADSTRRVFEAIARREPEAAALAHDQKLQAMCELERRHNPSLAAVLYAS